MKPVSRIVIPTERSCTDCNESTTVMLEMKPGVDCKQWWLCSQCWSKSVRQERV